MRRILQLARTAVGVAAAMAQAAGAWASEGDDDLTTLPQPEELPTQTSVLTVDDTGAHGPTARNRYDLAVTRNGSPDATRATSTR